MTDISGAAPGRFDAFGLLARIAPLISLLALVAFFATTEPRFLSSVNLFNVMCEVSIVGLLAIGMTFVILTAGIDLSVGSLLALAGLVAAAVSKSGLADRLAVGELAELGLAPEQMAWCFAALAAIGVGLLGGLIQGLAITRLKVPSFVVTLGGMSAFRSAAFLFAGDAPISGFNPGFVWWGQGRLGPIPGLGWFVPIPVIIFLAFAVLAHIALRYSRYGRKVYAVGSNSESAWLSGLNVRGIRLSVYAVMGFFVGLGAFVFSARMNSVEPIGGTGYELIVVASVVIGGTSLFGGVGTIFGTVVGVLLIGVLLNGLVLMDVSSYIQQIIIAVIFVLAVAFDRSAKTRRTTGWDSSQL